MKRHKRHQSELAEIVAAGIIIGICGTLLFLKGIINARKKEKDEKL